VNVRSKLDFRITTETRHPVGKSDKLFEHPITMDITSGFSLHYSITL